MNVLVTGGSGTLRKALIHKLADIGYEVVSGDLRSPGPEEHSFAWHREVAGTMAGYDAVVHLVAIAEPYRHPDERVFRNNVLSTFAVLQTAMLLEVGKAVVASSVSAHGPAWVPVRSSP